MAAHSGKGSANGSGANPALDADAAEELAANFRPAWAADDDDDLPPAAPPAPEPAPAPAIVASPVVTISNDAPAAPPAAPVPAPAQTQKMLSAPTVIGMPSPVRAPEPSSEALDSQNLIEVAPAAAKPLSQTQPMGNSARAAVAAAAAAKPVTRAATRPVGASDPFRATALDSDEFPPIRKSNKGVIFGVVGVGIAVGLALFLKFALSPDDPAKPGASPPATTAATKENDIPPPPPKDEVPAAATTATATPPPATAKADPPPAATTAEPPKAKTAEPPPKAPDPPRTVAAAPPKTPKQPAASPPPAAAPPKTPPKATSGGIVRDSPF